jgi:zinc/manganese transport system ATP-binding protein
MCDQFRAVTAPDPMQDRLAETSQAAPDTRPPPGQAIRLHNVAVRYSGRIALEGVSGTFAAGSLTAVVGANGAGKSTLLAAVAGTVRLAGGTIERPPRGQLAYLPQRAAIDREYPISIAELIALGGWREIGAFRAPSPELRSRIAAAASVVGLTGRLDRRIGELSPGEFQRVLFARIIVQDAAIILLDEPFAAVDAPTIAALLSHIDRWHREGRTVIAVLHDLDQVRAQFPETVVLARRCLAWDKTPDALAALAA